MLYTYLPSPLGDLLVAGTADAVSGIWFPVHRRAPGVDPTWVRDDAAFTQVRTELAEFFAGGRQTFDVALDPHGTPFQLRVWEALRTLPYGTSTSYGELARMVGAPGAARAVGAAVGRNPISIVVPCHRVVGSAGAITGYAGGLPAKRFLLDLETGAGVLPV